MTDPIEAALQLGFGRIRGFGSLHFRCTEAQLIAFAKMLRSEAAMMARIRAEQFGTLTTSFQELRALATDLESNHG